MKKNIILALILTIMVALKGLAINSIYKNTLKEIEIKETGRNAYTLEMLFGANYTEPLSLQKKEQDDYSIILPETKLNPNGLNIVYESGRKNVSLEVSEHPYIDSSIKNGYVKILVHTKNSAKVDLLADVGAVNIAENNQGPNIDVIKPPESIATEKTPPLEEIQTQQKEITQNNAQRILNNLPQTFLSKDNFDLLLKLSFILFILLLSLKLFSKMLKSSEKANIRVKDLQREHAKRTPPPVKATHPIPKKAAVQPQESAVKTVEKNSQVNSQTTTPKYKLEEKKQEEKFVEPTLISTIRFTNTRGIYLIQYEDRYSLIGYINDNVFVLKQFFKIENIKLQARLYEKTTEKVTFIIRIDDYKALVEMSADNMKVVIEF